MYFTQTGRKLHFRRVRSSRLQSSGSSGSSSHDPAVQKQEDQKSLGSYIDSALERYCAWNDVSKRLGVIESKNKAEKGQKRVKGEGTQKECHPLLPSLMPLTKGIPVEEISPLSPRIVEELHWRNGLSNWPHSHLSAPGPKRTQRQLKLPRKNERQADVKIPPRFAIAMKRLTPEYQRQVAWNPYSVCPH
eukprot:gnl/TRDRNA2_/TRDRNA2_172607_c2_seq22.p1 gnl/TRDRNA2_/TRDRNA2_172607_c2~~gnl/TRDRNA2_/TRDRNA2_172607_c2_seq22.p1  ORF type:complete len:190 (-),score=13.90 gnl/TRDRNA2_/TRDRNA2_172607_c2_seq22:300-869(-)